MADQPSLLLRLPDELLVVILGHLPVTEVAATQQTCRQLARLIEDGHTSLWRDLCMSSYHHWGPRFGINNLLEKPASQTNWRALFAIRVKGEHQVQANLDIVLNRKVFRIATSLQIVEEAFNAKDALVRQINCPDNAEDVLARRYYARSILGSINRKAGLDEWQKLLVTDQPLERMLGVFDQFIAEVPPLSLDGISQQLDNLAEDFATVYHDHGQWSTRVRALKLVEFMRSRGFTGVHSDGTYHSLCNNLIGVALCDADHSALPLINAAIYSCVAKRLGINAHLCNFPFHILVIVEAERGSTLDGGTVTITEDTPRDVMYLDPFRAALEVNRDNLLNQLDLINVNESQREGFMSAATTVELVNRTWRNIIQALQESQEYTTAPIQPSPDLRDVDFSPTTLNPHRALYVVKWANMYFGSFSDIPTQTHQAIRTRPLAGIIADMQSRFQLDVHLVKSHIFPLFPFGEQRDYLDDLYQRIIQEDSVPAIPKRRCEHDHSASQAHEGFEGPPKCVKYKIGQLFRHKRYGYLAAIVGWDTSCEASDGWISQMKVDALPNGRDQSFYNVMVEDESERYVAEENIEPLGQGVSMLRRTSAGFVIVEDGNTDTQKPNASLLRQAGQHFKRWDDSSTSFVSNMKDQYPDD